MLVAFSEADSADKNDLSPVLFECDHRFSTIYSSRRNLLPRKLNQEEKVRGIEQTKKKNSREAISSSSA